MDKKNRWLNIIYSLRRIPRRSPAGQRAAPDPHPDVRSVLRPAAAAATGLHATAAAAAADGTAAAGTDGRAAAATAVRDGGSAGPGRGAAVRLPATRRPRRAGSYAARHERIIPPRSSTQQACHDWYVGTGCRIAPRRSKWKVKARLVCVVAWRAAPYYICTVLYLRRSGPLWSQHA